MKVTLETYAQAKSKWGPTSSCSENLHQSLWQPWCCQGYNILWDSNFFGETQVLKRWFSGTYYTVGIISRDKTGVDTVICFHKLNSNQSFGMVKSEATYNSSPSLIRPPYLPRNCGHIRKVAFGERETWILITLVVVAAKISGHIRECGLCWEWPLRDWPLYIAPYCTLWGKVSQDIYLQCSNTGVGHAVHVLHRWRQWLLPGFWRLEREIGVVPDPAGGTELKPNTNVTRYWIKESQERRWSTAMHNYVNIKFFHNYPPSPSLGKKSKQIYI